MFKRLLVAALLCVPWAGTALAQQAVRVPTCGQAGVAPPNVSPLFVDANGNLCINGGGGGTAPGTSGATAQPVQGVTGGVAVATKPGTFTPLGCSAWQAVTTGGAVALSAVAGGIPAGATLVDIVPSVTVVMRDDGGAPTTAGPGIPIQTNTIYPYSGTLSAVQFIAQTTSGTISACFYR